MERRTMSEHLLPVKRVCEITSLSRTTIYRHVRAKTFPKPVQITSHRIGWPESEIEAWIARQKDQRSA